MWLGLIVKGDIAVGSVVGSCIAVGLIGKGLRWRADLDSYSSLDAWQTVRAGHFTCNHATRNAGDLNDPSRRHPDIKRG
jgi:hypothetical protein